MGIKGVIVNGKNKALALLKNGGKTFWDVPGGRIEKGETIEQALRREMGEEIPNLKDYKIKELLHVCPIERTKTAENIELLLVFYKIEADIEEIELSEEHQSYKWFSLEEIDSLTPINSGIKEALRLSLN